MSAAAQEPFAPIMSPSSSGRRIALAVGVNGPPVPGRAALKYAAQDASDMAQVLQDACGFELFRPPLLEEQATTERVRQSILDLADELNDGDFLVFYFSGHGEPMKVQADLDDVYFVTYDFKDSHVRRNQHAHLSMRWLREVLYEHEKAVDVLLILECCYAGNMGQTGPISTVTNYCSVSPITSMSLLLRAMPRNEAYV
jgi:uncharacterized caspase-like protein